MAYIHMGRKHKPKANSAAGSSPSLRLSQEEERGQQASYLQSWEGKSPGSELNGRRVGVWPTEEETGMALEQQAL